MAGAKQPQFGRNREKRRGRRIVSDVIEVVHDKGVRRVEAGQFVVQNEKTVAIHDDFGPVWSQDKYRILEIRK